MYIEAYGNVHHGLTFIAAKFCKPIVRMNFNTKIDPIQTNNILVVYSDCNLNFNTLTFAVKCNNPNAIWVESGNEYNLLLAMFNLNDIYIHSFSNSVLYVVGSKKLSFQFEFLPKTKTFRTLYNLTKLGLENNFNLEHFGLCKIFTRNQCKWKDWHSWWNLLLKLLKHDILESNQLSLQFTKRIDKIYKKSQHDYTLDYGDLYKCEISLDEEPFLGIMYNIENDRVQYISPMIVSRKNSTSTFHDVNQIVCTHWLPLYFNKHMWFTEGIYFYLKNYKQNLSHLKKILNYLDKTTIEKYNFIKNDLLIIYNILT